jgi:hypothetical protein
MKNFLRGLFVPFFVRAGQFFSRGGFINIWRNQRQIACEPILTGVLGAFWLASRRSWLRAGL